MQACPTEQSCSLVTESESSAVTLVRFDFQKRGKRQAGAVTAVGLVPQRRDFLHVNAPCMRAHYVCVYTPIDPPVVSPCANSPPLLHGTCLQGSMPLALAALP